MKYYLILAIILVLVIFLSLYFQQEGFVSINSDIPNGEGLSKPYLLHTMRLFNENVREIYVVKKKMDGNTVSKPATLKINGSDAGVIEDLLKSQLQNVDYINITMRDRNKRYKL